MCINRLSGSRRYSHRSVLAKANIRFPTMLPKPNLLFANLSRCQLSETTAGWLHKRLGGLAYSVAQGLASPQPRSDCQEAGLKQSRIAASAAWKPHIPWTPPPGGVDEEQR